MSEEEATAGAPGELVEHFFRHESAKLIAVLTRAFGFARLGLVEDKVQEAMMAALTSWRHRGVPNNPAGWIHRVARNRILDVLRREQVHQRALSHTGQTGEATEAVVEEWLTEERLPDSLLRMMFVCCHPSLDRRSQIAMTLQVLCGFSVAEVARGLLLSTEATKKRIQRAKKTLAERQIRLELPPPDELDERLATVQAVLYLLFNEGYSSSQGDAPLRSDMCEEAARLCHLLAEHVTLSTPATRALLALMLFHAARLESRVDADGVAVLLAEQDRAAWDHRLICVGRSWLERSKTDRPSRFHYEAAIALLHCEAQSVETTRWQDIVRLYDRLLALHPSPIYRLNRAIALGEAGEIERARAELDAIHDERPLRDYYLLDCATARLHELTGDDAAAIEHYRAALARVRAPHERTTLTTKIRRLGGDGNEE